MVRKMAYIGFSYLIGLFFASFFKSEIVLIVSSVVILICVSFHFYLGSKKNKLLVCIYSCAIGAIIFSLFTIFVYNRIISYDGQDIIISGKVIDIDEYSNDISKYTIKGKINNNINATVNCIYESQDVVVGDKVIVNCMVKIPENSYNFSSKDYLYSNGIFIECVKVQHFIALGGHKQTIVNGIDVYSNYLYTTICSILPKDQSSILIAMMFGDKSNIDSDTKTLMYRSGIGHMMAVSGAHLAIITMLLNYILSLFHTNKYVKMIIVIIISLAFIVMSGASISVIRAGIMLLFVQLSTLFKRKSDILSTLGITIILLTLPQPYIVRNASFLLSIAGVIGVGAISPCIINKIEKRIHLIAPIKLMISSFSATIIILPFSFMFFDEMCVISPLTNLVLIPLCTIALVLVVFVALTGCISVIATPLLTLSGLCCKAILVICEFIGKQKWTYVPLGLNQYKSIIIVFALCIVFLYFITRERKVVIIISAMLFITSIYLLPVLIRLDNNAIKIVVFSGSNSCVMIVHDNYQATIIDVNHGSKLSDCTVKYLSRQGINKINTLMLSDDAITSQAVYKKELSLFEVDNILIQEGDYLLDNKTSFGNRCKRYNNMNTLIGFRNFSVLYYNRNEILIFYNNKKIVAVNTNAHYINKTADVFIAYKGVNEQDIDTEYYLACDENAKCITDNNRKVIIGDNTIINIDQSGKISMEEISSGYTY